MHARAWCEVDLTALRENARRLQARAGVPLVPMVKADGYGLGAVRVATALGAVLADDAPDAVRDVARVLAGRAQRPGARAPEPPWGFGVATVAEGRELRDAGVRSRLLCCSPVLGEELATMAELQIIPALHRAADIEAWGALRAGPWHLAVDTGMNRAGVPWQEVASLAAVVRAHPPQGVFTHFHTATDRVLRIGQEARFAQALSALPLPSGTLRHTDASGTLVARWPGHFDLVRPGIALYGSPAQSALQLQPVVHVHARVVDVRDVAAGETVSYEATWTATRPSRIATVALGHADGYRRSLSNRGRMWVRGRLVPVAGVVTMDMTMLDVTDAACEVGDVATAVGQAHGTTGPEQLLSIDDVAASGGLSPYELLVGWRLRLPRVYREEP